MIKNHKEYILRLGGIDYNHGERAFICASDLEMDIEIRYKDIVDNPLVNGKDWNWDDCDCSADSPIGPSATIEELNFNNKGKANLKVTFIELDY